MGAAAPSLNSEGLQQLLGQLVTDVGAAVNGALVILGDRLGIYAALADIGQATSQQLAAKTGLDERQLREWLSAQAASGYITYDVAEATFSLTPEQAAVFADPNSPVAMTGGFYSVSAVYHDEPVVAESFRTGSGGPLGRASRLFVLRSRAVLPTRLRSQPLQQLDTRTGRRRRQTDFRDYGCRYRMRSWRINADHGEGVSEFKVLWV